MERPMLTFSICLHQNTAVQQHWMQRILLKGWNLLEVLDEVSPGSVNSKQASKPPIKIPYRKFENCNQVVKAGKQLKLSLVNVSGNDIVQGNKKLILDYTLCLEHFQLCLLGFCTFTFSHIKQIICYLFLLLFNLVSGIAIGEKELSAFSL